MQKLDSIGRFTSGIAHDFNNILAVIKGYSDILGKELSDNPQLTKYVNNIQKSTQKGSNLVSQLMTFTPETKS